MESLPGQSEKVREPGDSRYQSRVKLQRYTHKSPRQGRGGGGGEYDISWTSDKGTPLYSLAGSTRWEDKENPAF